MFCYLFVCFDNVGCDYEKWLEWVERSSSTHTRHSTSSDLYQLIDWLTMGSHGTYIVWSLWPEFQLCEQTSEGAHRHTHTHAYIHAHAVAYSTRSRHAKEIQRKIENIFICRYDFGGLYLCAHIKQKKAAATTKQPNKKQLYCTPQYLSCLAEMVNRLCMQRHIRHIRFNSRCRISPHSAG